MDADLKQIIDTNYPEWDMLTVEDPVNVVGSPRDKQPVSLS